KKDFYRSEHQKRKDEICPFSSLAFLQPTTVDKEPIFSILFPLAPKLHKKERLQPLSGLFFVIHF
ncbi:hypothetical protein, partial [Streptococcus pneumoniae]|uniref:hypothetical protein n=1 Tax=Streptococcus pneumoniae TaxID=1313 RepID=UPI001C718068